MQHDPDGTTGPDLPALLAAAAAGDEAAWRGIIDLYGRRVYALARSRLGGPGRGGRGHDLAEEVTQSVFVTIATKISQGAYAEQGRFESWLFRVAMNRVRDEVRRMRRQPEPGDMGSLESVASAGTSDADPDTAAALDSLRGAVASLSESDREVIELRHHAGLSFNQIAELLAEPLGTLLARHHRALRKLKELMTGENNRKLELLSGDQL